MAEERVLAADALGTGALAPLDRLDEPAVVALGDDQDLARLLELRLGEHERAGRGERQRHDAVERALQHRAARHLHQVLVEALVQLDVVLEGGVVGLVHGRVHLLDQADEDGELAARDAALGGEARGGSFDDPAQLDGVVDVGVRELAHHVPAAGQNLEQALVLELRQRQPQRRPRHAEALDQRQLGDARAGRELAAQEQFAQPEDGPHGL